MSNAAPPLFLNLCPICGYSLEGLPVEHRCPECGFPFDRRWHVFSRRIRPGRLGRYWPVFTVLGITFQGCFIIYPGTLRMFLIYLGVIVAVLAISVTVLMFRRTRWLAITPTGIRVYRERDLDREFKWSEFTTAEYFNESRVTLRGPTRKASITTLQGEIVPLGEMGAFVDAVNSYPYRLRVE